MISTYGKFVAMIGIGLLALASWLIAWDYRVETRPRWSFLWFSLILMGFEMCIIVTDVGFN